MDNELELEVPLLLRGAEYIGIEVGNTDTAGRKTKASVAHHIVHRRHAAAGRVDDEKAFIVNNVSCLYY